MKAQTVEEPQDGDLVRTVRWKTQLELDFRPRATGEARSDLTEATEIRPAIAAPESSMMAFAALGLPPLAPTRYA